MPEQPITRTDTVKVVANSLKTDQYGHLHFQDDKGNEYLLSKKRAGMFSIVSTAGDQSLKLSFSNYDGKEYLALVSLASVSQPPAKQTTPPKEATQPPKSYPTTTQPISGAEKGMILKEIGDNFRAKVFTPATQPDLWNYYKSEIGRVTGVKIQ